MKNVYWVGLLIRDTALRLRVVRLLEAYGRRFDCVIRIGRLTGHSAAKTPSCYDIVIVEDRLKYLVDCGAMDDHVLFISILLRRERPYARPGAFRLLEIPIAERAFNCALGDALGWVQGRGLA